MRTRGTRRYLTGGSQQPQARSKVTGCEAVDFSSREIGCSKGQKNRSCYREGDVQWVANHESAAVVSVVFKQVMRRECLRVKKSHPQQEW